jgi:hypothetical protein
MIRIHAQVGEQQLLCAGGAAADRRRAACSPEIALPCRRRANTNVWAGRWWETVATLPLFQFIHMAHIFQSIDIKLSSGQCDRLRRRQQSAGAAAIIQLQQ